MVLTSSINHDKAVERKKGGEVRMKGMKVSAGTEILRRPVFSTMAIVSCGGGHRTKLTANSLSSRSNYAVSIHVAGPLVSMNDIRYD